jgi:hypothetical protein
MLWGRFALKPNHLRGNAPNSIERQHLLLVELEISPVPNVCLGSTGPELNLAINMGDTAIEFCALNLWDRIISCSVQVCGDCKFWDR